MKPKSHKSNLKERFFFWIPRSLLIIAGLLFFILSIDAFAEPNPFWLNLIGFIIHLIPFFIIAASLYFSWKHEKIISIFLFAFFIITIFFFNTYEDLIIFIIVSLPFLLSSILMYTHNLFYNKNK